MSSLPPRSIFANMSRETLIQQASQHPSRARYLASLGFKTTKKSYGLTLKMKAEGLTLDDLWPSRMKQDLTHPEPRHALDLTREDHAYFYGLALADGHLQVATRGRGKLTIGLKSTDRDILDKLHAALPWKAVNKERHRVTNFGPHTCCELVYHSRGLRAQLIALGFPTGKKSHVCCPPEGDYHVQGFWRGFIDGDGSLGFAAGGYPFISLVTTSDCMAEAYKALVLAVTDVVKESGRNARDNAYNVTSYRDQAVALVTYLYPEGCLALERKRLIAESVKAWAKNGDQSDGVPQIVLDTHPQPT